MRSAMRSGVVGSRASATSVGLGLVLFAVAPPARDLFAEHSAGQVYWIVFFALVFLWAVIVHFSARKALEQQAWAAAGYSLPLRKRLQRALQARYAIAGTWTPRLLGLLCFVAVALGIRGAPTTSELLGNASANGSGFGSLLAATAVVAAVYLAYVVCRRLCSISLATSLEGHPGAIVAEPDPIWFLKLSAFRRRAALRAGRNSPDVKAMLLVGATVICFVAAAAFPLALSYFVPRAWFVPIMLGLPVFVVAFATAVSHYIRFPVLLSALLAFGWLATLAPHFHDARLASRPTNARDR